MTMSFDEMKVEAKELGVVIFRKKKEQLMADIVEARKVKADNPQTESPGDGPAPANTPPPEAKTPVEKKFNSVSIYDGKAFIRKYSLAIHGKKFADIATSFSKDHGYRMELTDTGKSILCPDCGSSFYPRA